MKHAHDPAPCVGADWDARCQSLWQELDRLDGDTFVARMRALVGELAPGHAIGCFELGCAQDSTGHPDLAVPLYRDALAGGITGIRRRRAVIQMSSSLRNLGHVQEAVDLLTRELEAGSDELDGAVRGFLALALADQGQERLALSHALQALARLLPRYNRSLANYARDLVSRPDGAP
jgi:hypothetical protein